MSLSHHNYDDRNLLSMLQTGQSPGDGIHIGAAQPVDVDHVDFDYVEKCEDKLELQKIKRFLEFDEPYYPELLKTVNERLLVLSGFSRSHYEQQKASEASTAAAERASMNEWISSMNEIEKDLLTQSEGKSHIKKLPAVRGTGNNLDDNTTNDKKKSKETVDKKEKEIKELEERLEEMSEIESRLFANSEKEKGNESFRAKEWKESLSYYGKAIYIYEKLLESNDHHHYSTELSALYNNRCAVYLKLDKFNEAIDDASIVIDKFDKKNIKAYYRRSCGYEGKLKFADAIIDIKTAQQLQSELLGEQGGNNNNNNNNNNKSNTTTNNKLLNVDLKEKLLNLEEKLYGCEPNHPLISHVKREKEEEKKKELLKEKEKKRRRRKKKNNDY